MTPAQELNDLFAVHVLHAGFKIDIQILYRVVVNHLKRYVIIDAADGVNDLRDAVEVDDDILIRRKSDDFFNFL